MSKEIRLTDFKKNSENPFLKQAIEKIEKNIVKKYRNSSGSNRKAILQAINPDTGEVMGHTTFIQQVEVDEEQFTKLYLSQFPAFFGLSQKAIRVFGYILTCMKPTNDMIVFLLNECMDYTGYKSKETIYKALAELVNNEIIARGVNESLWYINPMIMFNGDRVTFAKSYVKKKELKAKKEEDKHQLSMFDEPGFSR